jgi:oxygen-independent coproporphyrinogen-3 oxidase
VDISIYIHFPFCLKKCLYCDFNSLADSRIPFGEYVSALVREMELRAAKLAPPVTVPTLYLGGGTPSLMAPELVGRVIDAVAKLFGLETDAEITLEANPGTLSLDRLAGYRAAGVNRLSLGVQSFNDAQLMRLGRIHSAREAKEAYNSARAAGFANIGMDLIHSLPGETPALWTTDLSMAVALGPEHISAYDLTVEEGTPFHLLRSSGRLHFPGEDEAADMFQETALRLGTAGYEQYEISNFARAGFRSRHNQVYWRRGAYLGFGAGAHSFSPSPGFGVRWRNAENPERYMEVMAQELLPEEELTAVSQRDAMAEFFFLGLRMREGVAVEAFHNSFGISPEEAYPYELAELLSNGLLEREGDWLRLSGRGMMVANQVFMRFL